MITSKNSRQKLPTDVLHANIDRPEQSSLNHKMNLTALRRGARRSQSKGRLCELWFIVL
jgi:hypothetical protein